MSPINSNGSKLKVTTNFGDKTLEGDGIAGASYNSNQQQEERTRVHPSQRAHPFWSGKDGHIDYDNTPRTRADELLNEAIAKDLSDKNIKLNPTKSNDNPNKD